MPVNAKAPRAVPRNCVPSLDFPSRILFPDHIHPGDEGNWMECSWFLPGNLALPSSGGKMMRTKCIVLLVACCSLPALAQDGGTGALPNAVPAVTSFSGTITGTEGTRSVTFALYNEQTGGVPLWLETQNVMVDSNGHYSVVLGANQAGGLPPGLFTAGEARWLGVQ